MAQPDPTRIAAIVLAAGAGSRFGGGKLLAPIDGRPIIQHVLDRLATAGIERVVVVLGDDAPSIERAVTWRSERHVRNPAPEHGLSSSLRVGVDALDDDIDGALVVLGDQPRISPGTIERLLAAGTDGAQPLAVPTYDADGGRNPVLVDRSAFGLLRDLTGDHGLGPLIAEHPELVRSVAIPPAIAAGNPDLDTRDDHVALLEAAWAERVRANAEQVDRVREVPDGTDFYAPVTSLFRADPTRTDEPALAALLGHVRPGETWLDIGAGAGRYALPIARALAPSGGAVVAVDPSGGMLAALREIAADHAIENVRTVAGRWPDEATIAAAGPADVALIAHVGYDIAAIGPFVAAMEAATRRLAIAVLMDRQPSSIADVCWPPTWGEARVALPALPAFVELLRARGRDPEVAMLDRAPRRFASRDELAGFLRRQLWVAEGTAADGRFLAALDAELEIDDDGGVGLRGQRPMPIGIVTWAPADR